MDEAEEFIQSFLNHERIYDPVKAHEYYERTKQLKGKRSTSKLRGKKKKEGWAYVQSRVRDMKKSELKGLGEKNKVETTQLRETGRSRREELSAKIKLILEGISSDVKTQIEALPKGLSKEDRAERVARIRATSNEEKDSNKSIRDSDREKLATDLKATLDGARTKYKTAREAVKAKYERKLDSEYEALRTGAR